MGFLEILAKGKSEEERRANNSLPTSEEREERIADLLNEGYITPDEAMTYREQLTELPRDRKGLVVAYFLLGIDTLNFATSYGASERIAELLDSYKQPGEMVDVLTDDEKDKLADVLPTIRTQERLKRAETFVDVKRRRIRAKLLKMLLLDIALSLSYPKPKKGELDNIAYLRDGLKRSGYQGKGKSLSESDKEIIQSAAEYYLDLLELAFLNGEGERRGEEYRSLQDEDGNFKEEFNYRDDLDEALTEFSFIYYALDRVVTLVYGDTTPRWSLDLLAKAYDILLHENTINDRLKGGKFSYLLEEDKL